MKSLLLDLRSNTGGLLSQAVDMLDQLVPENQKLVYTRGRIPSANADYYSTARVGKWTEGPLVVLIDHGSASASEIVAGAVQDLDRGLVVGLNSFGKGLVQNQLNMSEGKLLLTVARYYTPSGRSIQRPYDKGIEEYQVEAFKEDAPSDSALQERPKFKTGAGRVVYGGGGIYPDVLIKEPTNLTRTEIDMLNKRVFFEFSTAYVSRHKGTKWSADSFSRDKFTMSDADWADLRKVLDLRKVTVDDSTYTAEKPFMLRQVRADLASATLGSLERYRIAVEDDTQLNNALELFPQAQKLLSTATEAHKNSAR